MYFIHQEVELIDLGKNEPSIQLLFESQQEDFIDHEREISIVLN